MKIDFKFRFFKKMVSSLSDEMIAGAGAVVYGYVSVFGKSEDLLVFWDHFN